MLENGKRFCDRCGVRLSKDNNKCGYELCDECNEWLNEYIKSKEENENKL